MGYTARVATNFVFVVVEKHFLNCAEASGSPFFQTVGNYGQIYTASFFVILEP